MDFSGQFLTHTHESKTVRVGLAPDRVIPLTEEEYSGRELFTTDSSGDKSEDDADDEVKSDDELEVSLPKELPESPYEHSAIDHVEEESLDDTVVLSWRRHHFPPECFRHVNEMLHGEGIRAWLFRDLQAAEVPVRNDFELSHNRSIYHNHRRASRREKADHQGGS